MYWQQIWFLVNMVFVALLITFMFTHRSVSMARLEQNEQKVKSAVRVRNTIGIITIIAFLAMIASFLMNMRVNG
ncbi:hypothetical protein [Paenibacillus mendelii]|uniref:Uncharacterized protein n=1 Tax=Paenibacillus mendelii TaxID=206163 RepID=A0ABV6JHB5_9BACL|nr:hypothetical protein [Paenibacillus mendelii]MCQ6558189.1 hypothetical protein [Paenibacillus mendelii]